MANTWGNMADHVGVLIALITIMGAIIGGMIRYWWYQMDKKMDFNVAAMDKKMDLVISMVQTAMKEHQECQRELPHKYVLRTDWSEFHLEWKDFLRNRESDWREMWKAFNNHSHDDTTKKVIRDNGR